MARISRSKAMRPRRMCRAPTRRDRAREFSYLLMPSAWRGVAVTGRFGTGGTMNTQAERAFSARVDDAAPLEQGLDPYLSSKGRYRICMELAAGGMGSVYVALYRGTDGFERVVALKRMHAHLSAQAEFVKMFFDEAQLLARVKHPAVCSLLDLGKTRDSYFLVMEYV